MRKVYDLNLLPTAVQVRIPSTPNNPAGAIVEVEVNWSRVAQRLGYKAMRSRAKRSGVMEGAVRVKVIEVLKEGS